VICLRWPKCLNAVVLADVDLPYWTSEVEHIAAFTAICSNICTAHAQKRFFMNFRCKFTLRQEMWTNESTINVDHIFPQHCGLVIFSVRSTTLVQRGVPPCGCLFTILENVLPRTVLYILFYRLCFYYIYRTIVTAGTVFC